MKKKYLLIFLVAVNFANSQNYNRIAVERYSDLWASDEGDPNYVRLRDPNYHDCEAEGYYDCANFVSACIRAGGQNLQGVFALSQS